MADNLFRSGDFLLSGGGRSTFKIDCDALTYEDWECLAEMAVDRLPQFNSVVSVPTGGDKLAAVLRTYAHPVLAANPKHLVPPILIVDDVLTTGRSMQRVCAEVLRTAEITSTWWRDSVFGLVVFARGPVPTWITALFTLTPGRSGP